MASQPVADELFLEVYGDLRRLARRYLRGKHSGATLQPTALVHEAFLQLSSSRQTQWESRSHFLGVAARAMRQVLAQSYRRSTALKRDGGIRIQLWDSDGAEAGEVEYGALEEALKRLEAEAPELGTIVELRFFGGLSVEETAEFLSISPATVKRHWRLARLWLFRELK